MFILISPEKNSYEAASLIERYANYKQQLCQKQNMQT